LLGWTRLKGREVPASPEFNPQRARLVLGKIDEILGWERTTDRERDIRFVALGRHLCEVRAGQYWKLEQLHSFDEFLEKRFPESRRKAYYLMSVHEHLPPRARQQLRLVGWSKAAELAKVARRDGESFDCATWLHKAQQMPKQQFKDEVDKYLNGTSDPSELMFFKVYRTQLPVIEQALEAAGRLLGSERSRGYCLEMICADFLAGVAADGNSPDLFLEALRRSFRLLPAAQQQQLLEEECRHVGESTTCSA
jgi:hypothetical protein